MSTTTRTGPPRQRGRLLTIAALALGLAACGRAEEPPDLGPVVRPIRTALVGMEALARLSFPGVVQAADRADISFRVGGELVQLRAREGDFLDAGQLVAQLDTRDFEIAVQEAQAIFDQTQAERDRYQRLYEREAVPLADLELRIAQRDVAAARLQQARLNLDYTTLRAPFTGWVGRRLVENFERVQAQQSIVTLHDIRSLEIVIDVPELVIARFRAGSDPEIVATFAGSPEEYPLEVKETAAEADPQTRTFQLTLSMPQPRDLTVLPGMTGTVIGRQRPDEARADALTIPAQAVSADAGGASFVWVVDQAAMTVSRRPVSIGEPLGVNSVEIFQGLQPGEMIAVTAVGTLQEGMQVRQLDAR